MEQAEAEKELELYYSIPNTGSNLWMDAWCMPKSSQRSEAQKELAELFLDFLSIPEYTAQNMDYTGYTPFTAGNDILDLTREWYDYRYDEETGEFWFEGEPGFWYVMKPCSQEALDLVFEGKGGSVPVSEAEAAFELVLGSELLPLCPKGFPNMLEQIDAAGIRDLVDGGILFTARQPGDENLIDQRAELQIQDPVRVQFAAFVSQQAADVVLRCALLDQLQGNERTG